MSALISYQYLGTITLLVGTLVATSLTDRRMPDKLASPLEHISGQIAGWTASGDQALAAGPARVLNATSYLARGYQKGDQRLDLFVAFYAQQRAGESMHSPKHCLPGAGWEIWQLGSARVPVNGKSVSVNKYSIENAGSRQIMFYWYQSRDRIIASEYLGKLLLARDALLTGHTSASIVRITLPDTPAALAEGVAFASRVIPEVWRCFGGTS
jgi:EpsI family protein